MPSELVHDGMLVELRSEGRMSVREQVLYVVEINLLYATEASLDETPRLIEEILSPTYLLDLSEPEDIDYVVIAPWDFKDAAETLASYRSEQGLETRIVSIESLYHSFADGERDPRVVKAFIDALTSSRRATQRSVPPEQRVLGSIPLD